MRKAAIIAAFLHVPDRGGPGWPASPPRRRNRLPSLGPLASREQRGASLRVWPAVGTLRSMPATRPAPLKQYLANDQGDLGSRVSITSRARRFRTLGVIP